MSIYLHISCPYVVSHTMFRRIDNYVLLSLINVNLYITFCFIYVSVHCAAIYSSGKLQYAETN